MKVSAKLTQKQVDSILSHPIAGRQTVADGRGLALAVYRDSEGRTRGSYILQARTLSGKALCLGLGSAEVVKLEAARAKADEHREALKAGRNPVEEKHTARVEAKAADASTLERFVEDTYGPLLVSKNRKDADGAKDRILASWAPLAKVPIAQITERMICDVIEERKKAKKPNGDALSPTTIKRDWATFRPCLVHARKLKMIHHLPIEGTPAPLEGVREEPARKFLGKDDATETKRFLDALVAFRSAEVGGGEFLRVACALALNAGLRRGEVVRLCDDMIILTPGRERLELPGRICKGNKARMIPLNADAIAAIRAWREVRKTLKVQSVDGALFPGDPELWADRLTQREFPELCQQAKIDAVFKTLRATFASLHVQRGTSIQIVQQWLGHHSVTVTERHYGFLKPDTGQELARAFKVS